MYSVQVSLTCDMCDRGYYQESHRKNDCSSKESYRRFMKQEEGWKTITVNGKTYDICRRCAEHYGRDIKDELRRRELRKEHLESEVNSRD